jgi:hypothetical protein
MKAVGRRRGGLWGIPILLGVLSVVGLLSALLGDGVWDAVSWATLGLPVAAAAWFGMRRHRAVTSPVERPGRRR